MLTSRTRFHLRPGDYAQIDGSIWCLKGYSKDAGFNFEDPTTESQMVIAAGEILQLSVEGRVRFLAETPVLGPTMPTTIEHVQEENLL